MTEAYRLHSSRYPGNDGRGAAINGGRWNPKGTEVIYASASRSLAILEILAHYAVLPKDFLLTPISIPDSVSIMDVPETLLVTGWNQPLPMASTQEYGRSWIAANSSAVLSVPSTIVPSERNYVLNVMHPDFRAVVFGPSEPFPFDPRLK